MSVLEQVLKILEDNKAIVAELVERVVALEEEVDDLEETIRGLTVDVGQVVEEQNAYRMEIDELAADFDCFRQDENA